LGLKGLVVVVVVYSQEITCKHFPLITIWLSKFQITKIAQDLDKAVCVLDQSEKQIGDEVNQLIQNENKSNDFLDDNELDCFRQTAFRVGIASSAAALTERRALRRLLERAHAEEDLKKESIAACLLHLMRKYSEHI
jgi:hypothetical protein